MLKRILSVLALLGAMLVVPTQSNAATLATTAWKSSACSSGGSSVTYKLRAGYLQYSSTNVLELTDWSGPAIVSSRFLPLNVRFKVNDTWSAWRSVSGYGTQATALNPLQIHVPRGQTVAWVQLQLQAGCIVSASFAF